MMVRDHKTNHCIKILMICFILAGLIGSLQAAVSAEESATGIVYSTVRPFLDALKTGNVQALASSIGGRLAGNLMPIIEDNPDYPEILRACYEGIEFELGEPSTHKGRVFVLVELLRGGTKEDVYLLTIRKNGNGLWKIVAMDKRI
jgi:hypothetical protein